jgi:dienelactone hydrolase
MGVAAVAVLACAGCGHGSATKASGPVMGTRDVVFPSGSLELKGTLQVPDEPPIKARPAVILVHGSGPQSRDQELEGQVAMGFGCSVSLFEDLADGLEDAGFAVLRYDKRTCGPFNDCADNGYPFPSLMHTVDDLVKDAAAGARWLAKQPDVDASRIYVVGHSEGGQLVPRLLTDVPELRGGVMLAAPHNSIDMVMLGQVAFLDTRVRTAGKEDKVTKQTMKELFEQVNALQQLREGTYQGPRIGSAPTVYWKSWMKLGDEAPALAAATAKPILVLSGNYDWNVPSNETEEWKRVFEAAPETSAAHETEVLPCVTHAMNCIRQPKPEEIKPGDIDCDVDDRVIEKIAAFLKRAEQPAQQEGKGQVSNSEF